MSQISAVKDQLLSLSVNNFIILTSVGNVVECGGDFTDPISQKLAYAILQQCNELLDTDEEFSRATYCDGDVTYVATSVREKDETYGVMIKKTKA